ncbi:hypothetical protein [Altererythrobacter sp. MTPC7]|uniref:hypothetical protein n=1 Tax=Altererythrobacter sp. MTPC7 TaxID=3056567 RepID=UPI0036F3A8DC
MTDTPDTSATPPAKRDHKARNHKSWSRRKMVVFLRELAASQSVSQAAKAVGMSRQSAYVLRNRLRGTPFDLGWETALELGFSQLAQAVMDRAVNGEEVPHYHGGELVGTHRKYDNRLAQWILQNPWELGRMQVAREYTSPGFEALLERIEWAGFDWEEGESLPVTGGPITDREEGRKLESGFLKTSWYADIVEYRKKRGRK